MNKNINDIVKFYNDGYSTRTLGKLNGVSQSTISRWLKNHNILVRSPYDFSITSTSNRKTYNFNKNFFLENSDELAYMMGFILADGNLYYSKKHNYARLSINVHKKDSLILEYFKKISLYTKNITTNNKSQNRLFYTDPIFKSTDFSKWGLVPNKTYFPSKLDVDFNYLKPFIIGYIDGDGSITCKNGQYKFNIVGNKYTIDQIITYIQCLDCNFNFEWHWENPPNKVWKRAILTKKEQLLHLISILEPWKYFYLPRKWDKAVEILNDYKF
jgi:hypothetical protein